MVRALARGGSAGVRWRARGSRPPCRASGGFHFARSPLAVRLFAPFRSKGTFTKVGLARQTGCHRAAPGQSGRTMATTRRRSRRFLAAEKRARFCPTRPEVSVDVAATIPHVSDPLGALSEPDPALQARRTAPFSSSGLHFRDRARRSRRGRGFRRGALATRARTAISLGAGETIRAQPEALRFEHRRTGSAGADGTGHVYGLAVVRRLT